MTKTIQKLILTVCITVICMAAFGLQAFADYSPLGPYAEYDRITAAYSLETPVSNPEKLLISGDYAWIADRVDRNYRFYAVSLISGDSCVVDLPLIKENSELSYGVLDDGRLWICEHGKSVDNTVVNIFSPETEQRVSHTIKRSVKNITVSDNGKLIMAESYLPFVSVVAPDTGISVSWLNLSGKVSQLRITDAMDFLVLGEDGTLRKLDFSDHLVRNTVMSGVSCIEDDYAVNDKGVYSTVDASLIFDGELARKALNDGAVNLKSGTAFSNGVLYSLETEETVRDFSDVTQDAVSGLTALTDYREILCIDSANKLVFCDSEAQGINEEAAAYIEELPDTFCGELAKHICLEHGIYVYWDSVFRDISSFWPMSYEFAPEDESLYGFMSELNDFLDTLPDGMTTELLGDDLNSVRLYLCSAMGDAGTNYSGYTILDGDSLNMMICTGMGMKIYSDSIRHEFFHAASYRISSLELWDGHKYMSGWFELMPEWVQDLYFYNFSAEEWQTVYDTTYTAESGSGDEDSVWFVRAYSRLDYNEDTATTFELMCTADSAEGSALKYPHINEKAKYLAAALRICFPSCTDAENLPWEKCLQSVDIHEFDDIIYSR